MAVLSLGLASLLAIPVLAQTQVYGNNSGSTATSSAAAAFTTTLELSVEGKYSSTHICQKVVVP